MLILGMPFEFPTGRLASRAVDPYITVRRAHLGRNEEVVKILEQYVLERPGIGSADDSYSYFGDYNLLEAAVLVGHGRAAELLLSRLSEDRY